MQPTVLAAALLLAFAANLSVAQVAGPLCYKCVELGKRACNSQTCTTADASGVCDCAGEFGPDYTPDEGLCLDMCEANRFTCYKCNVPASGACDSKTFPCRDDAGPGSQLKKCNCNPENVGDGYTADEDQCNSGCLATQVPCEICQNTQQCLSITSPTEAECLNNHPLVVAQPTVFLRTFLSATECRAACHVTQYECFECNVASGDCESQTRTCPIFGVVGEGDCVCQGDSTMDKSVCDARCQKLVTCSKCQTADATCIEITKVCPTPDNCPPCDPGFEPRDKDTCLASCHQKQTCKKCIPNSQTGPQCVDVEYTCDVAGETCECSDCECGYYDTEDECLLGKCNGELRSCFHCDTSSLTCKVRSGYHFENGPQFVCNSNEVESMQDCEDGCFKRQCYKCQNEQCIAEEQACNPITGCPDCSGYLKEDDCLDACEHTPDCSYCDNSGGGEPYCTLVVDAISCALSDSSCRCEGNNHQSGSPYYTPGQACFERCTEKRCYRCEGPDCVPFIINCVDKTVDECPCPTGSSTDPTCGNACLIDITCYSCNKDIGNPQCTSFTESCAPGPNCNCGAFGGTSSHTTCVEVQQCEIITKECHTCWREKEECKTETIKCRPYLGEDCDALNCTGDSFATFALCDVNCERYPKEDPKRIFGHYGYPHKIHSQYVVPGQTGAIFNYDNQYAQDAVGVGHVRLQHEMNRVQYSSIQRAELCSLPAAEGWGTKRLVRWYYDFYFDQTCKHFIYRGDLGNPNNFRTKNECDAACGHNQFDDPGASKRHSKYDPN